MGATASRRTASARRGRTADDSAVRPEAGGVDRGALNRRLGYLLRRAQIAVFHDFFAAFADHDIRPAQYSVLTVIEANPGLKQGAVGEALGVKRPNIVAMIDELERRGLVRRAADASDRRRYALMLTPKGARLMTALDAISERHERRLIEAIGPEAYHGLFAPLRALARIGEPAADAASADPG